MSGEVGSSDQPIIGGRTDYDDPSVVAVVALAPNGRGNLCTGAVISPTTVLTAAHCVDPRYLRPKIGDEYVFEVRTGTDVINRPIDRLAVSCPRFDRAFNPANPPAGHDIAVVTLAAPTTLPPLPYNRGALGNGSVRIVGYGNDSPDGGSGTKRTATTNIGTSTDDLVLIGRTGKQTCLSDSGGPAFQKFRGQERIIALASYVLTEMCEDGGWETRVDAYLDFIEAPPAVAQCEAVLTFEEGAPGVDGTIYGSHDTQTFPNAGTALIRDGYILDVEPNSTTPTDAMHFHEVNSADAWWLPLRDGSGPGVLARDSYSGVDPTTIARQDGGEFSVDGLVVGFSADAPVSTVRMSGYRQGQLVGSVDFVMPQDSYTQYTKADLGVLTDKQVDRLEFLGFSPTGTTVYFMLDDVRLRRR